MAATTDSTDALYKPIAERLGKEIADIERKHGPDHAVVVCQRLRGELTALEESLIAAADDAWDTQTR